MTTSVDTEHARCICGKLSFSHEEAEDVVRRALVSRVLHRNARRAEQRSYPCDRNPGVWHVTSQKDSRPLTRPDGSLIMEYGLADDAMAMSVITRVLSLGNDSHWTALLTPDRVSQTRRVLAKIRATFDSLKMAQGHAMELAKARYHLGEITPWEQYEAKKTYFAWKEQVAPFQAELTHRFRQAEQSDMGLHRKLQQASVQERQSIADAAAQARAQARAVGRNERLEKAAEHNNQQNVRHRAAVRNLTLALVDHKKATVDPTAADLALWDALDNVVVPAGSSDSVSVGELVARGSWTKSDDIATAPSLPATRRTPPRAPRPE